MSIRTVALAALTCACSGGDLVLPEGSGEEASRLVIVAGDGQSAPVRTELPSALVVRVADDGDNPVASSPVTWLVTGGGGTVTPSNHLTDGAGQSAARWTLGSTPGEQAVTAVVSGVGVAEFTANATGGGGDDGGGKGGGRMSPSRVAMWRGNGQTASAGTSVYIPPAVFVTDASGDGVEGVEVTFAVTGGGGHVTGANAVTGDDGIAAVGSWTLGSAGGTNTLRATVAASGVTDNPRVFTATATVVRRLTFRVQPRSTSENRVITPAVQVAVVDNNGAVVPGYQGEVRLELLGGSSRAVLRGDTRRTLNQGIATFGDLRVSRRGNNYRLRALMNNLAPIESTTFDIEDDD